MSITFEMTVAGLKLLAGYKEWYEQETESICRKRKRK